MLRRGEIRLKTDIRHSFKFIHGGPPPTEADYKWDKPDSYDLNCLVGKPHGYGDECRMPWARRIKKRRMKL